MLWQYRTILFEFTKDGLLGDKYVDDEEMEKVLNQLGGREWELVSVSLLQDGLLAFLKRPALAEEEQVIAPPPSRPAERVAPPVVHPRPSMFCRTPAPVPVEPEEPEEVEEVEEVEELAEPERSERMAEPELIDIFDRPRKSDQQRRGSDFVGDIKIS